MKSKHLRSHSIFHQLKERKNRLIESCFLLGNTSVFSSRSAKFRHNIGSGKCCNNPESVSQSGRYGIHDKDELKG